MPNHPPRFAARLNQVPPPPISTAHSWVRGRTFPEDAPLIDVCQAVPGYPPPAELTRHVAAFCKRDEASRYTAVEGTSALRIALAADIRSTYGTTGVGPEHVLVTAGCNQAFCLAVMALAEPGDEVVLPLPWYFNHHMWLEMQGIRVVPLPFRPDRQGVPDPDDARAAIGPRTRAIVLVTPNNPTGANLDESQLEAWFQLAQERGIALVVDETYRDFLPRDSRHHRLFQNPKWSSTFVHLYSFSKVFCLTGYRVGSIVAHPDLVHQTAKAMDTLAICAPAIGQEAALFGLNHLASWRAERRSMMHSRLTAFLDAVGAAGGGYRVAAAGAYFAYLEHPFAHRTAEAVARRLADAQNVLCLPGSMFGSDQERYLRFAFANVDEGVMAPLAERLRRDAELG